MKKKILFLFTFADVNVFEPITIKLTYFIFLISLFFFLDAIFFKKIYVQIRFYSTKKLDFKNFIKNEIKVSVYSALLGCFIGIIISYLISVKKQFVVSIRNIRKNNEFLKQIKSILKVYEIKMIIFLIINFICMFVFWYFCTAFCSMYIKTTEAWLYAFIFTLIFTTIFQFFYAVIICCSDSRVIPENLFMAGIGALFVIRLAGNVVGDFALGSIEYAVSHLNTKLVLVMGHTMCGAIHSAIIDHHESFITSIINEIKGAIGNCNDNTLASKLNVFNTINKIKKSEIINELLDHDVKIVGSIYHTHSGEVEIL